MELSKLAKDVLGEYEALIFETLDTLDEDDSINGRQISQNTAIPKTTVHRILSGLTKTGLVKAKEHKSMTLFRLNRKHILYTPISELFKLRDVFFTELVEAYSKELPKDVTLLLYGSQARLEATATSDVNVLAVIEDDNDLNYDGLEKVTNELKNRIGNIINIRILTDADLRRMKRNTKDTFLKNVLSDMTHLHGIPLDIRMKKK